MKYLFLNTSTSNVTISIIVDNIIVYNYDSVIISDMSSLILSLIDEGLRKLKLNLKDIDTIFVVNGPGSFTGIRIGVSIAKTIAWALNKNIIPISSLELIATTTTDKKYIGALIDARRGNVFAGMFDSNLNYIISEKLVNLNLFLEEAGTNCEFVSYDNFENALVKKPSLDILKIINKHENDIPINAHNLNPKYLKLTEAEENLVKNG